MKIDQAIARRMLMISLIGYDPQLLLPPPRERPTSFRQPRRPPGGVHPVSQPSKDALRLRRGRIDTGEAQRAAERWPFSRSELILPVLKLVADAGHASPRDLYDEISRVLGLDPSIREHVAHFNGRPHRLYDRTVRWAMQDCKRQGWLFSEGRERWRVTEAGNEALGRVQPGVQLVIFRTELGKAIAAVAQEAAGIVDAGSVQALFTSPLFPLCSTLKSYGTMTPADWLPWMVDLIEAWMPLMRADGCLAVHLGSAIYYRGMPAISSYRERFVLAVQDELGLYRMPDLYWEQPKRWPNLEWGAKRGMHPRPAVDPIYIFSSSRTPFMDAAGMRGERTVPARPGGAPGQRASGIIVGKRTFAEGKTAFPSSLIRAGSGSADRWRKRLKESGLPPHPCPMPVAVPRFAIELLTRPGDLVFDPFFGSGSTGAAAEELGRRWVGIDHHAVLLRGAALRPQFDEAA